MLNGKIDVVKGFQTAVNIAYDLNNNSKIQGLIPTQSSLEVIEDILLSTSLKATQRSHILIGAYGRGKSHIILVLLALLANKDKTLFKALLAKMQKNKSDLYEFATEYLDSNRCLLPVVVRGSSSSLTSSFLSALQLTLNDEGLSDIMPQTHFKAAVSTIDSWKKDFPQTYKNLIKLLSCPIKDFLLSLEGYDVAAYEQFAEIYPQLTSGSAFNPFLGFDTVELYESVANGVKTKGYDGIFVVYDEFSKYLESSIANATISDIKLLQDFAEKCDRSGQIQMHLLLICHKDIATYIDGGLPKEKVDGWRGISGRFRNINLHNNYAQMYEIIAEVIKKDSTFWGKFKRTNKTRFNELITRFTTNRLIDGNNSDEVEYGIYGCYPLHPVSTFILPRLSEKVAQNERTLFTFLSSEDKYTLPSFLSHIEGDFPFLTPDYIYDYFEPLLRKEPYTSESHKIYKLTSRVLQKVSETSLCAKILKTIALIYLVEQFEKLPPTVDIITDTFRNTVGNASEINDALTELIENECMVYLKRSNNYLKIKDSSGIDIPNEIASYIDKNRSVMQVKTILNQSSFDSFMYPTRYNDEYEITRYFDFVFINGSDFFEVDDWEKRIENIEADGVVYAIIPKNETEIKKLNAALSRLNVGVERIVFIVPKKFLSIGQLALEYQAVKDLRSFVVDDELLVDEYDIYLDDLLEVINAYINAFVRPETGGSTYHHAGNKHQIYRRSQLSELLSCICEQVFNQTPIINNESINKNALPTVAINSRAKILSGLLATELAPFLGLTGTGQDVSIMRSTLIQTGVLQNINEKPTINLEPNDENLANVLRVICDFFNHAGDNNGSNFGELYDNLTLPQHHIGLKRGLIPIYVAVVLHLYKQNVVIKYKNEEVKITSDLLNGINESPRDYLAIFDNWNEEKATYLTGLENIFSSYVSEREKAYNGFAFIQLAMNRWYMDLPKYAKDLKAVYVGGEYRPLDKQRKNFINSLKQPDDNNPREYLLEKLFSIFKMEFSANILNIIEATKKEFDNAVSNLITALNADVKTIFIAKQKKATLTSILKDWHETLSPDTLQHLFPQNENHILDLMKTPSNDESVIIQRLAKAVTGLRIEDWSNDTIEVFVKDLNTFKQIVEEYNSKKIKTTSNADEYKLTFRINGKEVVKSFGKAKYTSKTKLLFTEITNAIEEMGQSITEQEKRQVLVDILQKLC